MVDAALIASKFSYLNDTLAKLGGLRDRSDEQLLASWQDLFAIRYGLVVTVECCVDVARHIIADQRWPVPDDAPAAMQTLVNHQVLAAEVGQRLADAVRFRNLVIHLYQRVDDQRVIDLLRQRLDDFRRFVEAIDRWLSHPA